MKYTEMLYPSCLDNQYIINWKDEIELISFHWERNSLEFGADLIIGGALPKSSISQTYYEHHNMNAMKLLDLNP